MLSVLLLVRFVSSSVARSCRNVDGLPRGPKFARSGPGAEAFAKLCEISIVLLAPSTETRPFGGAMDQRQRKLVRKRVRRLAEEEVAQIKAHLEQGKSPTVIARYFEVNPRSIYAIRASETYRHIAPAANATPLSKLSKTKRRV